MFNEIRETIALAWGAAKHSPVRAQGRCAGAWRLASTDEHRVSERLGE